MSTATLYAPCSRKRKLCQEYDGLQEQIETLEALASAKAKKRDALEAQAARQKAEAAKEDALYEQLTDKVLERKTRQEEIEDQLKEMGVK